MATEKRKSRPTTFEEIVGKSILVGVSYVDEEGDQLKMEQISGTVAKAEAKGIWVEAEGRKKPFPLPADLRAVRFAERGEYRIIDTGEVVTNPDLIATVTYEGVPKEEPPPENSGNGAGGKSKGKK